MIDFTGRLEIDSPTVPLAELLQSLHIVQTKEKDIQDARVYMSAISGLPSHHEQD